MYKGRNRMNGLCFSLLAVGSGTINGITCFIMPENWVFRRGIADIIIANVVKMTIGNHPVDYPRSTATCYLEKHCPRWYSTPWIYTLFIYIKPTVLQQNYGRLYVTLGPIWKVQAKLIHSIINLFVLSTFLCQCLFSETSLIMSVLVVVIACLCFYRNPWLSVMLHLCTCCICNYHWLISSWDPRRRFQMVSTALLVGGF